jgi:phosphoglycolate phosphatase
MFKAVIFDLDGTLLDTIDDLADSMNSVLKQFNYPLHDVEAYKYFVGNGMRKLVERALPESERSDENISRGHTALLEEYNKRWDNKTKPYNGIPELLDALLMKGIKIAVLTNKTHEFAKLVVEKLLKNWKFDVILGERKGLPVKPNPAGALEIVKMLDVEASECLYLGDTAVDMKTAVAAGMYAVGVLWGFRKADEIKEGGAKILISRPAEALDLL